MSNGIHYARCTGSLLASIKYAEIILRVGLEKPNKSAKLLRENMQHAHREMRAALFEQASREAALFCSEKERHAS